MTIASPDARMLSFPTAGTGAIMVAPGNRFLMQLRDDKPGVVLRGYWGVFGGEVEPGEKPEQSMLRELKEELAFKAEALEFLCSVATDFTQLDAGLRCKHFYVVPITEDDVDAMVLHEGERMALLTLEELYRTPEVVPTDLYALYLFNHREQFTQRFNG